jgi:hypothetical protein
VTPTADEIHQIRKGAEEARSVKLARLARLLDTVGNIAQGLREGVDPIDMIIELDNLVAAGGMVARDMCREMPPEKPAEPVTP